MKHLKEISFLIIEDDNAVRVLIKDDLKKIGVTGLIYEASDGKTGLEIINQKLLGKFRIEFVICDINMPKMNGITFLKEVRSLSFGKNLPVLLLTSESTREMVLKAVSMGASNYLSKPWKLEDLAVKLNLCWNKHNSED